MEEKMIKIMVVVVAYGINNEHTASVFIETTESEQRDDSSAIANQWSNGIVKDIMQIA